MRRLSLGRATGDLRARRWDVLVLGGALPGLAAAVRLGMAGLRVALGRHDGFDRLTNQFVATEAVPLNGLVVEVQNDAVEILDENRIRSVAKDDIKFVEADIHAMMCRWMCEARQRDSSEC